MSEQALDTPNFGTQIAGEAPPAAPQASTPDAPDIESRARAQGWVPQDEWRGDPEKWRPADEFVKRGEELLPIAVERTRTLERRLQDLEAQRASEQAEFRDQLTRVERATLVAIQRQRDQLEANYHAAMRAAVETGDTARYDQLARDRHQALDHYDRSVADQVQVQAQPQQPNGKPELPPHVASEVQAWRARNDWFDRDPIMNQMAQAIHMDLNRTKPGISIRQNLAEVERRMRVMMPDKFGGAHSIVTPIVEAGGGRMAAAAGPRAKGASDLPADVRATGQRFVTQGLFRDLNEYAREYFADND